MLPKACIKPLENNHIDTMYYIHVLAALKDIGAFSFLELNKGIIQMQVTIKLTR